jgi:hypothetical protein
MKTVYLILIISFSLCLKNSFAQPSGCTDILATNYNSSATSNDGSCLYSAASVSPTSSFNLDSNLAETSGLIKWDNHIWTHNDDTDTHIYSLDTLNGNEIQAYQLNGVVNTDWEEISQDDNFIYVGDFGNNANGNRTDLKILKIDKNSLLASSPIIDSINFSYSNQTDFSPTGANHTDFDCEAFVVTTDSIYLFTKQWVSNKISLYSLPKTPGTYIANLKATLDVQGLITGSVLMESRHLIALCGYSNYLQPFTYLLYDYNGVDYFGGNKRKIDISLPFHQVEGIATSNGLKYFISNEYFNHSSPNVTVPQQLHILDLSSFLNNYLNPTITGVSESKPQNKVSIFPNPATHQINVELNSDIIEKEYIIWDQYGKAVLMGQLKNKNSIIEIGNLSSGIYLLSVGADLKETFKVVKN